MPVPVGLGWQNRAWCGKGDHCHNQAIPNGAKLVNVDLFGTSAAEIRELAKKYIVTCYFSGGAVQAGRPDTHRFTKEMKGREQVHWKGVFWLDIRKMELFKPIMRDRMKLAKQKGCHGIEPDNIDCWQNRCVFDLPAESPIMFKQELVYLKWMSAYAHSLGLNIGFKNNLGQVTELQPHFDWAMNESCHEFNEECYLLSPFINAGKGVFATEYRYTDRKKICDAAKKLRFSQKLDVGGRWVDC